MSIVRPITKWWDKSGRTRLVDAINGSAVGTDLTSEEAALQDILSGGICIKQCIESHTWHHMMREEH